MRAARETRGLCGGPEQEREWDWRSRRDAVGLSVEPGAGGGELGVMRSRSGLTDCRTLCISRKENVKPPGGSSQDPAWYLHYQGHLRLQWCCWVAGDSPVWEQPLGAAWQSHGGLGGALCRPGLGKAVLGAGSAGGNPRPGSGLPGLSRPLSPPPLLCSKLGNPLQCPTTYLCTVNPVPEEAVASPSSALHTL